MSWPIRNWAPLATGLAVAGIAGAACAASAPSAQVLRSPSMFQSSTGSCGSSACGSSGGNATDCGCDTGGVGEHRFRHRRGGGGGGFGGGGGGGGGRGQGGGGGGGVGGSGNGGQGGAGGSVLGSFAGETNVSITGSLLNALGGNGAGSGAGNAGFTSAFSSASNSTGLGGTVTGSSNNSGSGGSSFYVDYNTSYIPNLSVEEGGAATSQVSVPYQATRSMTKIVAVQAVCLDDKQIPHPASQVSPDKDIADAFEGEIYRCIAGSRMQFTIADYNGKVSFDQGQTVTCDKNAALYHVAGGRIECRAQKPARDCNERSLLRRFGAGIKIVKIVWTETYTAYRTETRTVQAQASVMGMAIDGGVGGIAH